MPVDDGSVDTKLPLSPSHSLQNRALTRLPAAPDREHGPEQGRTESRLGFTQQRISRTGDSATRDAAFDLWRESEEVVEKLLSQNPQPDSSPPSPPPEPLTCGQKVKKWLRKYFMQGQYLDKDAAAELEKLPPNPNLYQLLFIKYRKFTAMMIPILFFHTLWWCVAIKHNFFRWYPKYWEMPVTMILGSFVGGITSEGSGAVAYPVMTLVLHIASEIARDFSVMIQSCGQTSAMFCIFFMKVNFEGRAVVLGTIGAVPGFILSVYVVDPHLTGPQKKMIFVSVWTAFAFSLGFLNRHKRKTYQRIPDFKLWKALILIVTGFIGGIFDGLMGSGIDICIFAMITLVFRVSEKTATPTTVCLKGINAMIGFFWRAAIMGDISQMAWKYFACTVPVSTIAGAVGSFLGSHLHRQVAASFVYVLEIAALIGFLVSKPAWHLIVIMIAIMIGGFIFFLVLSRAGQYLMDRIEAKEKRQQQLPATTITVDDDV